MCGRLVAGGDGKDVGDTPQTKYFFVHLPATASWTRLVRFAHQRWAIEQQYRELKTNLGLDHFEGRTFPGWHHHVVLTAITYNFLQAERRRHLAGLTFPAAHAIVQEIFTAYLFAQRPHYLKRIALPSAKVVLAARGESPAAFDRRCIRPDCVASRSNTSGILPRHALSARRITGLGATLDFHHGLLGFREGGILGGGGKGLATEEGASGDGPWGFAGRAVTRACPTGSRKGRLIGVRE